MGTFVLLQPGAMDLTMVIGHQVATQPPQWGVQVTVSWEEAKLLIGLLQNAVAGHEHTFGPVADVVKSVQDAVAKLQAEAAEGSEGGEEDG